jgi:outer membrane protein OmpA-like peptidoglycan-associated protein
MSASRFISRASLILGALSALFVLPSPRIAEASNECASGWTFDSVNYVCRFTITSTSEVTVTIPSGISSVNVVVRGAAGGLGGRNSSYYGDSNRGQGGPVGQVSGVLAVSPTTSIRVTVGANGSTGATGCGSLGYCGGDGSGGPGGSSATAGYQGGRGANQAIVDWSGGGGGGGAATILRVDNTIFAIAGGAGGGGGGGGWSSGGTGTTTASYVGGTAGASGVQIGGDGGGGGGGGGGLQGGTAGAGGGGDHGGAGGNAGRNLVPATWSGSYVSATNGSVVFSYATMPNNTATPTVPNSLEALSTVTGNIGTWTAVATHTYQWLACSQPAAAISNTSGSLVVPNDCQIITGATSPTLMPTIDHIGSYLRLAVTGSNQTGTLTSISASGQNTVSAPRTSVPDLDSSSDTGTSSTDNYTSDSTPLISVGNLIIGALVTVTATKGSESTSCTFTATSTTGSCTLNNMSDGFWTVSSTQLVNGSTSAAASISVDIDTTPPDRSQLPDLIASSDTGASSTDNITNDSTPGIFLPGATNGSTITITASRAGYPDVVCSYVASASATGCDLPLLADGVWNVVGTSDAVDLAGNLTPASPVLPITIRTALSSELSVDLAASSDTGLSSSDNVTQLRSISVGVPLANDGSLVTMTASLGGQQSVSCTYTASPSQKFCNLGPLDQGEWVVAASIIDPEADISGVITALPITIDLSTPIQPQLPDLTSSSDTGVSSTDNITRDNTPEIQVANVELGHLVTVVASRPGSDTVQCTFVSSATINSCSLGLLTDGIWNITSFVTNIAGSQSPISDSLSVVIDSQTRIDEVNVQEILRSNNQLLPDLLTESDSGISQLDNITTHRNLRISMPSAQIGETVIITAETDRGRKITCSYVASESVTSCVLNNLSVASWTITAAVSDVAGNTYESLPLEVSVTDIDGLPNLDKSNFKTQVETRGSTTNISVAIPMSAANASTRKIVVAVLNKAGKVIRRSTFNVAPGSKQIEFSVAASSGAHSVIAYAANEFGISSRAPLGSNITRTKRGLVCQGDGTSIYRQDSLTERVLFDPASATLDGEDKRQLNKVARFMRKRGGQIVITGLARKNGIDSQKFLAELSRQRAQNVALYLSQRGVRAWINYEGFGAVTKSIGTPIDRRVDICWSLQGPK